VNWGLMRKVASMWVLTLVFASVIASSMFAVLTAGFHPMTKPLSCGMVSTRLAAAEYLLVDNSASDMETLFASLDTNGDDLLDSDELEAHCPPLDKVFPGGEDADLTVDKFGDDDHMDKDGFLQFTCMSDTKMDHMFNKKCQPLCRSGYVPDGTLKCELDGDNEDDDGGFFLRTKYSGFTTCVPSQLECFSN